MAPDCLKLDGLRQQLLDTAQSGVLAEACVASYLQRMRQICLQDMLDMEDKQIRSVDEAMMSRV